MKSAIYAGSFDPWSYGHQYILQSALDIFDKVHVVSAVNPLKQGLFSPEDRARVIAHAICPFEDWWNMEPPFCIGERVIVAPTTGLVADYAIQNNISDLIRGLRSTSDFESEFNLYFSNYAISSKLKTWCLMCPPELLHCSSSFVKAVVGQKNISFVGTSFLAQSSLLGKTKRLGSVFDIILESSIWRFEKEKLDLSSRNLLATLQEIFLKIIYHPKFNNTKTREKLSISLKLFLQEYGNKLQSSIQEQVYHEDIIHKLWSILIKAISHESNDFFSIKELKATLGKGEKPLFQENLILKYLDQVDFHLV